MAMCGRFTLYADPEFLSEYVELENIAEIDLQPRFNIAPSQPVLTMVQGVNGFRGGYMRWGLIPFWAKDPSAGYKMINARLETVQEKRSFRPLVGKRHCLIIADGFYEWKKEKTGKQPFYIRLATGEPLLFAGLWDRWKDGDGKETISCTILTTAANDLMKELHDRMPVIVPKEKWGEWLQLKAVDEQRAEPFFRPFPSKLMHAYPVSTMVNHPKNNSADCIREIRL
ncbi:Putative SOS response-associated peptidase YedK [Evansella caseinilytica]|uniref:Abasic site processing protein n=1 Tax=Evansella caseinilytica TaxID=1503961 RepID=A0A1H3NNX7_9BACI|nr:SOS response-associated peptidase [Evansella caseinilytica]SDY90463.1 Putative SOS response-associated peptidase YedK [Evansella caseinilytica]